MESDFILIVKQNHKKISKWKTACHAGIKAAKTVMQSVKPEWLIVFSQNDSNQALNQQTETHRGLQKHTGLVSVTHYSMFVCLPREPHTRVKKKLSHRK